MLLDSPKGPLSADGVPEIWQGLTPQSSPQIELSAPQPATVGTAAPKFNCYHLKHGKRLRLPA